MATDHSIKVRFLGAAGTVTGSKYLVETGDNKLLVDCGLFQGLKELRELNWKNLPVDASKIDFVLLTHGHLDHVGYLPLLVKQGFKGRIYATAPTLEVAKLILLDSAKIQEEDAERANRFHFSKHKPAKPLYDTDDAEAVFPLFSPQQPDQWLERNGVSFRFRYNGHIIGACFIELNIKEKRFVFSGDVGRIEDPLLREPERPERADVLFIESTYGNRIHPPNAGQLLADEINNAFKRNGTIIIPSFAVERTQLLMYLLWQLRIEKKIPSLPVYMDSPMGKHVLDIFCHYPEWHKLALSDAQQMCKDIHMIRTEEETDALIRDKKSKIVIASSGMATGGRVLSYLKNYLGEPSATILLAGYQGEGTRGRALLDGTAEIKIHGRFWPVRAGVSMIEGLSAHADQTELIHWLGAIDKEPSQVFITHGEREAAHALGEKIKQVYHWKVEIPGLDQAIEIK